MMNQPLKLLFTACAVAVVAGSFLAQNFNDTLAASPASVATTSSHAAPSRSRFGGWFEGMEFNSGPRPAIPPATRVAQAALPPAIGFGAVTIPADSHGHFLANVEIDGQHMSMLVDTGATSVVLRHEDAQRLGILPMPSDYTIRISTANGITNAAQVRLREIRLDNIRVSDVQAVVMPRGVLSKSLLGMNFLRRLSRFEVEAGNLVLRP